MLRVLRHSWKFSSERLVRLRQQYNSSPRSSDAAFKYIRQLLREDKNFQAKQEMERIGELRQHPKIAPLDRVLARRFGGSSDSNEETYKSRASFALFISSPFMVLLILYGHYIQDALDSAIKQMQNPGEEKEKEKGKGKKRSKKKSKEEIVEVIKKQEPTKFSDVRGIDEFKDELQEIVDYLKNPQKYRKAGAKLPKGILMVGPPGTGKTMMARALANEAGCAFLYRSGAEFDEMFVGLGARRVRALFAEARSKAPAIIFIDEIDSVAGKRQNNIDDRANQTINQLLTEMDGFKQTENIIVIGATNLEKAIDPAIKRAGRFDKIINIPLPDIKGREEIFSLYLEKIKFADVTAADLAKRTYGFSGADIQNMVNQAVLNCVKNHRLVTGDQDFEFAHDRIVMGVGRTKMFVTDKDKMITAYHESGHTIVALMTSGAIPFHKVTMLPRGGALGFTSMLPQTDTLSYTKKELLAMIDVCFGGKVAEEIFMGNLEVTSGSSNDLQKATELAYNYVKKLGMQQNVSLICETRGVKISSHYTQILDKEVEKILQDSYKRVKTLLLSRKDELSLLALELIKKETLSSTEVKGLLKI